MTDYFGICMVIIVASLCVCLLSKFVYTNIFKAIEGHKKRVSDARWASFGKFLVDVRDKMGPDIDKWIDELKMKRIKEFMDKVDKASGRKPTNDYDPDDIWKPEK